MQTVKVIRWHVAIADYSTMRFCVYDDYDFRFKLLIFFQISSSIGAPHFKVVSTKNKSGRIELCAVPSAWECNKILKWPKNLSTQKITKIISNPLSTPESDWIDIPCEEKRTFASFELAQKEVAFMMERSDTADSSCSGSNDIDDAMKRVPPPQTLAKAGGRARVLTIRSKNADSERSNHNSEMETIVSSPSTVSSIPFRFLNLEMFGNID